MFRKHILNKLVRRKTSFKSQRFSFSSGVSMIIPEGLPTSEGNSSTPSILDRVHQRGLRTAASTTLSSIDSTTTTLLLLRLLQYLLGVLVVFSIQHWLLATLQYLVFRSTVILLLLRGTHQEYCRRFLQNYSAKDEYLSRSQKYSSTQYSSTVVYSQ